MPGTNPSDARSRGPERAETTGLSRRRLLQLGAAGVVVAGAGAGIAGIGLAEDPSRIGPRSALAVAAERARTKSGAVVRRTLRAAPGTADLGGRYASTWLFDGALPGAEVRANVGDHVRIRFENHLPARSTIHWHGLALRNDMDGVPGLTQKSVAPGGTFDYAFTAPHPGTYWFHPHVGVQLDTGLYGALIIEDPTEKAAYDDELVLILDDWTDGVGQTPQEIFGRLGREGMGDMGGMGSMRGMPTAARPLGADGGDVNYPMHLINGRAPTAPTTVKSRPDRRIRLRVVNAGSDTAYRFAIGGHRLTVTHADGFPVEPVEVDTLILGMGERYDVVITAGDGVFPVVAVPESKKDVAALAVLRTASGLAPLTGVRPDELQGRLLRYADLTADDSVRLPAGRPDRELDLDLTMARGGRRWLINGRTYENHEPLDVSPGERVRIRLRNKSMMFHPMHLHGHTFAVGGGTGGGVRKDTVNVPPMGSQMIELRADNPGQWLVHCHNAYHGELGMMTVLSYVR